MNHRVMLKSPVLGWLNVMAVLAAWVCLALFVIGLVYFKLVSAPDSSILPLIILFGAFVAFVVLHVTLSFRVRCPNCNKPLTAQGFARPKHGDWSSVVTKWVTGSVVCIHCGAHVNTKGI